MSQEEEQTVHISRRRLSELETQANAANDFIQHFQNIDQELKKERAKVKKFTKMLIDDQKVIEKLTSVRCISASDPSSVESRSLLSLQQSLITPQSIIEIDGSSGSSFSFPQVEQPFISPLPDSSSNMSKTSYSQQSESVFEHTVPHSATSNLNISRVIDPVSTHGFSLPYKRSASVNISVTSTKGNNNIFSDVLDDKGVSEVVFLNLVRELKRTKHCLNELMLANGISLGEFMKAKIDKATLEDMASSIEDLKKENENYQNKISELNNSLSFYKKLVRDEKEGLTVQHDSGKQEDKKISKDSSTKSSKSEDRDVLKVENCRLKDQLMNLEEEKNMILDNYAKCIQTISELEYHLNEDNLKKQNEILLKEIEKLQKEIKNLQNDNEKLVSSNAKFRDMWKQENAKFVKTETELKESVKAQKSMETEVNLLKAKVKHLLNKQHDSQSGKTKSLKSQEKIQAPIKPTKIIKSSSSAVESSSSFIESELIASSSLTGVITKSIKKAVRFECERCQAQFEDEMDHLHHIEKCFVD